MNMESVKQMVHSTLNDGPYKATDSNKKTERQSPKTLCLKEENLPLQGDGIFKNVSTCDRTGDYTGTVKERCVTFSPYVNEDIGINDKFFEKGNNKSSNYR